MKKGTRTLLWGLFAYYVLILVWVILFKMYVSLAALDRIRFVNLVPLAQSAYPDGRINVPEVVSNVLAFVPFGVYLSLLKPQWPFWKKLTPVFLTSLALEACQYAFSVGASDVTDLIGNTLGGAIGVALYSAALRLSREPAKTERFFTVLALVGTLCGTGLLLLLVLANG